jgi:hypothetical protein
MAQQYLVDINMNDDIGDVIRKVNHNFRMVGSAQRKQSQIALRNTDSSIREDLGEAISDVQEAADDAAGLAQDAMDLAEEALDTAQSMNDYETLINKPQIEGNTLIGDQTFAALGMVRITNTELDAMLT